MYRSGLIEAGRWRQWVAIGVQPLLGRKVVAVLALSDRPGNRQCHHRRRHLVKPVADATQAETAQGGREAIGEVLAAQQAEGERRVRTVEKLDAAGGLGGIDVVETQLALQDVECPIRFAARPGTEMRGTVDEDARPVQRFAHALFAIEVSLGHGANTTR